MPQRNDTRLTPATHARTNAAVWVALAVPIVGTIGGFFACENGWIQFDDGPAAWALLWASALTVNVGCASWAATSLCRRGSHPVAFFDAIAGTVLFVIVNSVFAVAAWFILSVLFR